MNGALVDKLGVIGIIIVVAMPDNDVNVDK